MFLPGPLAMSSLWDGVPAEQLQAVQAYIGRKEIMDTCGMEPEDVERLRSGLLALRRATECLDDKAITRIVSKLSPYAKCCGLGFVLSDQGRMMSPKQFVDHVVNERLEADSVPKRLLASCRDTGSAIDLITRGLVKKAGLPTFTGCARELSEVWLRRIVQSNCFGSVILVSSDDAVLKTSRVHPLISQLLHHRSTLVCSADSDENAKCGARYVIFDRALREDDVASIDEHVRLGRICVLSHHSDLMEGLDMWTLPRVVLIDSTDVGNDLFVLFDAAERDPMEHSDARYAVTNFNCPTLRIYQMCQIGRHMRWHAGYRVSIDDIAITHSRMYPGTMPPTAEHVCAAIGHKYKTQCVLSPDHTVAGIEIINT